MNNEIKKLIEELKDSYGIAMPKQEYFGYIKGIEDYITNLQQENERLKEHKYFTRQDALDEALDRIDKAIEYINNLRDESAERQGFYNCFPDDLYIANIEELLDILEGSDKE